MSRIHILFAFLLALFGCAPDGVTVAVRLSGLPPEASALHVLVKRGNMGLTVALAPADVFALLTSSRSGTLSVYVEARDSQACAISSGSGEILLDGGTELKLGIALSSLVGRVVCPLSVNVSGMGTVSSNPPGIACPEQCEARFTQGQQIELRAQEPPESSFGAWAGCIGRNPCTVLMGSVPAEVSAIFDARECSKDSEFRWCKHRPTEVALHGIAARLSQVIVVGEQGTVLRWDGAAWNEENSGTTADLRAIWGPWALWAVGNGGAVTGSLGTSSWQVTQIGTNADLHALWGTSAANIWAVGGGGGVLRWDGIEWRPEASGTSASLHGVWGSSGEDVWAAGEGGTLLRRDQARWSVFSSGTNATLYALWGSGPKDIWAAGQRGTLLRWNGSSWTPVVSGTDATLRALWGSSSADVWAAGEGGVLLHWDGQRWRQVDSGTRATLNALWGSSPTDVWAAGEGGVILRYGGPVIGLLPEPSAGHSDARADTARSGS